MHDEVTYGPGIHAMLNYRAHLKHRIDKLHMAKRQVPFLSEYEKRLADLDEDIRLLKEAKCTTT